jgi:hypothetical protein
VETLPVLASSVPQSARGRGEAAVQEHEERSERKDPPDPNLMELAYEFLLDAVVETAWGLLENVLDV